MAQGPAGNGAPAESDAQFSEAYRQLRADESLQFTFSEWTPPEVPLWLKWLADFIEAAFPVLKIIFWVGVAAAAAFLIYVIVRRLFGAGWPWRRTLDEGEGAPEWRLEEAPARALLREADGLAADGRFSEAVHLLLFRSIEEIDSRRPGLLRPALTSRDIARTAAIPDGARAAFSAIAMMVEKSLFGGRALEEGDWRRCRAHYEDFAFAESWR